MLLAAESANPLNSSALIFPALEVLHIAGMALSIGTIAILDFRLLDMGLRRHSPAALAKDMAPWSLFGLVLVLFSGAVMYSTDPDMYYLNSSFQIKMVLLALGLIFNYTMHRKVALAQTGQASTADGSSNAEGRSNVDESSNKMVAWISLLLWAGVIAGGIFIAFVGDAIPELPQP